MEQEVAGPEVETVRTAGRHLGKSAVLAEEKVGIWEWGVEEAPPTAGRCL